MTPPSEQSNGESELGRTAGLVNEVVEARERGDREETHGNADDDLLGAVEELEYAIKVWRATR